MNVTDDTDKAHVCRACLSKENLQNIRESYVIGRTVYSIFCECTGVNHLDSTLIQLCSKCQYVLIQFYELKCRIMNHIEQIIFKNEVESTEIRIKEEMLVEETVNHSSTLESFNMWKKSSKNEIVCYCPACLKPCTSFRKAQECMTHHIIANGGLECHYCGNKYQRNILPVHIRRVHLRDFKEIFPCDICGITFTHKNSVDNHKRWTHKKVIGKFKCDNCSKVFRQQTRLNDHVRVQHEGTFIHHCALCSKSFVSADSLKNHLKAIHISEKQNCSYCGRQFSHKSNRITHEKLHKKEQSAEYFCDQCGFITNTQNNLKRHKQVHSDIRKYVCSTCGAKFRTSSGLNLHSFTHQEKRFACHLCQKLFSRPQHVKTHIDLVHLKEKKLYECEGCSEKFTQKIVYKKHVKSCLTREK